MPGASTETILRALKSDPFAVDLANGVAASFMSYGDSTHAAQFVKYRNDIWKFKGEKFK
jgi:hypothetical protein